MQFQPTIPLLTSVIALQYYICANSRPLNEIFVSIIISTHISIYSLILELHSFVLTLIEVPNEPIIQSDNRVDGQAFYSNHFNASLHTIQSTKSIF